MNNNKFYSNRQTELILAKTYVQLLNKFKEKYSKQDIFYGSYMLSGKNYNNELLLIGKEPKFWPGEFSIQRLKEWGAKSIFRHYVRPVDIYRGYTEDPLKFVIDRWQEERYPSKFFTKPNDPFWNIVKGLKDKLYNYYNEPDEWYSYFAFTYLYKIAFCEDTLIHDNPRLKQLAPCRRMLNLEIEILQPKRIFFLTGLQTAKYFLNLPDYLKMNDPIHDLGNYTFGNHTAKTFITVTPKKYLVEDFIEFMIQEINEPVPRN